MAVDYVLNPPLGIDLGTTYSVIARWDGKTSKHYNTGSKQAESTFQSVVWYDQKSKKYLTDRIAYRRTLIDPEYGIVGVKRLMDKRDHIIKLGDKEHSPMEISAKIIDGMYTEVAGMYAKDEFRARKVVVSVPYYFKAHQCANTREAVELAGLECAGIIQEPVAASLKYVLDMIDNDPEQERDEIILVFDLGGGTFDLTLFKLKVRKNKVNFEVLASGGDDRLGGLDFDEALAAYILASVNFSIDKDSRDGRRVWQKVLEESNNVKQFLSSAQSWTITIPYVMGDQHIEMDITREQFEQCIEPFTNKIHQHIDEIFSQSGLNRQDVTRVIKVGGSSKIPVMDRLLEESIDANKIYNNADNALYIAEGAAIYAAYLDDSESFDREIEIGIRSSHALGIKLDCGTFYPLIEANTKTPCSRSQIFGPSDKEQQYVDIEVYQGKNKLAEKNDRIGRVHCPIPAEAGADPDIKVIFTQDNEQTLLVKIEIGKLTFTDGFTMT